MKKRYINSKKYFRTFYSHSPSLPRDEENLIWVILGLICFLEVVSQETKFYFKDLAPLRHSPSSFDVTTEWKNNNSPLVLPRNLLHYPTRLARDCVHNAVE